MQRGIWVLALILTFIYCSQAQAASKKQPDGGGNAYTLEKAVEQAVKANPSVEAKRLALESARMNVGVAQSYFWPRVSITGGTNRLKNYEEVQTYNSDNLSSYNWNKGLRVSYSLFAGFSHLNNLQKSLLNVEIEKQRQRQATLELGCNVQLQFLQLLRLRDDLKTAQASIKRIETQLASAEAFVNADMAPYLNVLQNRTELANAQQELIRVKNDIRNAEVQLNRYLGLPHSGFTAYRGDLKSIPRTVGISEEEAIKEALAKRPDLIIAQKSVETAFKDMNMALGQFLPRIDLTYDNVSQSKDYDDGRYQAYTRKYWSAGLSFTWEIFSGGQAVFGSLAEKRRAESLRKDYEEAVNQARTEVIRSLLDIEAAKELIAASRRSLEAATESYDMAEKRYQTDTGTITELLDAQLRLTQAENSSSQAFCDFHSARARLFYYLGRSNPSLR